MPSRIPPWEAISTAVPVAVQAVVPVDIQAAVPVAIAGAVPTAVSAESLTVVCKFEDHLRHFEPNLTEVCMAKGPPPAEVRS